GFLRQGIFQNKKGFNDVSSLMLGAGLAFIFEAIVVGLIVPAAPYGPASYYNYDRVAHTAFVGEKAGTLQPFGLTAWLDYAKVLQTTGLPIQFWRMISAIAVSFFVVRGLDVFEAIRKRQLSELQTERDRAQQAAFQAQILARQNAEQWTDLLININRRIIEFEDMERILLYIIESIRNIMQAESVGLALMNEANTQLFVKCYATKDSSQMAKDPMTMDNSLVWDVIKSNQSYYSTENTPLKNVDNFCALISNPIKAIAIVPIRLDNQPIGILWIARCADNAHRFSGVDLIWLECMADQVVIAIQHGIMTSRMQSLSIANERARIARDMHDGLAQVLGYINVQVQALDGLLKQGKMEELENELKSMRTAVLSAHQDVRENILSLRTTLANEKGFIPATTEFLDEFSIQTGINIHFTYPTEMDLNLSSLAEVQLICIIREALNNVRKHSQAKRVDIQIKKINKGNAQYINLLIHDDGKGFIEKESKRSFGLQTMRERAQSVHGSLNITSVPGKGTTLICNLPCLANEYKVNKPIFPQISEIKG
ncbi:MAG: GAF domain-containing sensor histidine kinase, partial [Anaerolineales bacterium]